MIRETELLGLCRDFWIEKRYWNTFYGKAAADRICFLCRLVPHIKLRLLFSNFSLFFFYLFLVSVSSFYCSGNLNQTSGVKSLRAIKILYGKGEFSAWCIGVTEANFFILLIFESIETETKDSILKISLNLWKHLHYT